MNACLVWPFSGWPFVMMAVCLFWHDWSNVHRISYECSVCLKPRLRQTTCCRATSNMLPGNMLLVAVNKIVASLLLDKGNTVVAEIQATCCRQQATSCWATCFSSAQHTRRKRVNAALVISIGEPQTEATAGFSDWPHRIGQVVWCTSSMDVFIL